jgi:signal peptidase I
MSIDDEFNAIIRAQLLDPEPVNSAARTAAAQPAPESTGKSARPKGKSTFRRFFEEWFVVILIAAVVAVVVRWFLFSPFYIPSSSMEPTLQINDKILINKLSYRLHDVNRGDVVVFKRPPAGQFDASVKDLVKRVIGLPGDEIEIRSCKVYINGGLLEEPYTRGACTEEPLTATVDPDGDGKTVIPESSFFVMGDNRCLHCSEDSRFWGFLDEDLIEGRAFVLYWPRGNWKWL